MYPSFCNRHKIAKESHHFCIALLCIICTLHISCTSNIVSNQQVQYAIDSSGDNYQQLQKVLSHYHSDPQKLEAAQYLIANMIYHRGLDDHIVSPNGEYHEFDLKKYSSKTWEAKRYCDSLFKAGYAIKSTFIPDITSLDSQFLINNIDLAFEVWRMPWAKELSFKEFCYYILPYRSANEKVCPLRREFMERYLPIVKASGATTPLEACIALNNQLCKEIRYLATGSPLSPTIESIQETGVGDCLGLAIYTAFAMRAVGIPVIIDQTIWPKMANGHAWCSVLNYNGKFYDFNPGDQFDSTSRIAWYREKKLRIPAKVYRIMFHPQKSDLPHAINDNYYTYLKTPILADATEHYPFHPINLCTTTDIPIDSKNGLIYLCVFNRHQWLPIALGQRQQNRCVFKKVIGDNVFIIADSPNGEDLRNITAPFFVDSLGNIQKFIPNPSISDSVILPKMILSKNHLNFWNIKEQRFETMEHCDTISDSTVMYKHIPHNTLLLYAFPPHAWHDARIFYQNKEGETCIY